MKVSTTIRKAREQYDTLGQTSNAVYEERNGLGKIVAVCAQAAIDRVKGGARRAAIELVKQVGMSGLMPRIFNDGHALDEVKEAFDVAYIVALEMEGADVEKALS